MIDERARRSIVIIQKRLRKLEEEEFKRDLEIALPEVVQERLNTLADCDCAVCVNARAKISS